MNLDKKIVLIVGGSRGLGRALAELFIAHGSRVGIVSKNKANVEATAGEIGAIPFVADVRNEKDLRDVARAMLGQFGRIDIWVNSVGIFKIFPKGDLIDMERAHELFDVNFFGTVFGSRTALSCMNETGGILLNILSTAALDATRSKNAKLYAASKWAVRGWIDALRGENMEGNIALLSVYPGGMKTHFHDEALPSNFEQFMDPNGVAQKVIDNLRLNNPEQDLIVKRPTA